MLLHWRQLTKYYGEELNAHLGHFHTPGQTTYGLLCCRFAQEHTRLMASQGEHSEERLLQSLLWRQIERTVQAWYSFNTDERAKAVVTLVLNRSPCHSRCVPALFDALNHLQYNFSKRFFDHWRFILACRGAYQGKVTDAGFYEHSTTTRDLQRLEDAGWQVCVLQTTTPVGNTFDLGEGLPPGGQALLQGLMNVKNVSRPSLIRLDG
ncbi:hypothetical protein ACQE3D_10295 [Methylomonas sp. MS20]|uniref:hypothetical protein n=1 Tax=unclassified Methylomonas TaxID=2608980 RepID=UPI0028A45FF8|nr:hypothetical protein [Methylomonas sp. MV1]MDT4328613.1 hypothetical protein [Methylomonas sp. MV1]